MLTSAVSRFTDRFRAPAYRRARMLQNRSEKTVSTDSRATLSWSELAVLAVINSSKTKLDIHSGRSLRRAQIRLSHRAGQAAAARVHLRQLQPGLQDDERRLQTLRQWETEDESTRPTTSDRLVSRPLLGAVEVVFVLIEFFFWNQQFNRSVDSDDTAGHLASALIALAIPMVGVLAARITGGLCHRWWRGHEPNRTATYLAAATALAFLTLSAVVICWLVVWRFQNPAAVVTSLTQKFPAAPLAGVFVAILLGDALARTFLISEVHAQKDALRRSLHASQRRHRRVMRAVLRADHRHRAAWHDLQHRTSLVIGRAARINEVGSVLVLDHRDPADAAPAQVTPWRSGKSPDGRAIHPYVTLRALDDTGCADADDPTLRRVADALATLAAHPPLGRGPVERVVDELGIIDRTPRPPGQPDAEPDTAALPDATGSSDTTVSPDTTALPDTQGAGPAQEPDPTTPDLAPDDNLGPEDGTGSDPDPDPGVERSNGWPPAIGPGIIDLPRIERAQLDRETPTGEPATIRLEAENV